MPEPLLRQSKNLKHNTLNIDVDNYSIAPIQEKDAWRLCDFVVANETRLKDYFPETLAANLTPTLAEIFVQKKAKQFLNRQEFLFTIKENTNRTIIGLIYLKSLKKIEGRAELAYCIGYQYKGQGLTTKFAKAIIDWAFKNIGLDAVYAIIHDKNSASKKVVLNNKFTFEKILPKEHKLGDGTEVDMELYVLPRTKFENQQ